MTSPRVALYALPLFPRHWVAVDRFDGSRHIVPCTSGGWHKGRPLASGVSFDPAKCEPSFSGIGLDLPEWPKAHDLPLSVA